MNFYLMHKDITVAEIIIRGCELHIERVINPVHMPWGVRGVPDEQQDIRLARWLEERCVPKSRNAHSMIIAMTGVSSMIEMPEKSYMCSLTDCYWFKPIHDTVSWAQVNFYDNGFDETAGKVLLNEDNSVTIENWNIPELTTNGVLPKRWFQGKNGGFYLLKAGTPPDYHEVYNEAFASQCAQLFGLDAVPYAIYRDNTTGIDYSVCPSFIHDDNEEFVSLEQIRISLGGSKEDALEYLYTLGLGEDIDKYRGFDYLVKNTDRHFGNIGIIRDSNTLEIKRLSPLFDHGFSMVLDKSPDDFTQKLTDNSGSEELAQLMHLKWVSKADVSIIDFMRRVRANYSSIYDTSATLRLATEAGTRLQRLQERAEDRERLEREMETRNPFE